MSQILHSVILGQGRPLVILHGFLGMLDNWKSLGVQYAEHGLEVHLVDQRNHGKSFWSETFDLEALSGDLNRYMEYKGLTKAVVMGHSMGGKVAMQFACDRPAKTEKLIVADIAPKYYPPHHQTILNALQALDLEQYGSRGEADEALSKYLKSPTLRQFLLKNLYWKDKGRLGFRMNLDVLAQRMEEIGENIPSTATYEGPTLFLRGDRSEYVAVSDLPMIKRHFPMAILETIPRAGHWLHAENPQDFLDKTLAFIQN